jgi:DNA-binding NarL/FixJ family response regulator
MTSKTARPRVVIADDHAEMVKVAASLLGEQFDVVATAHDGASALECIRRVDPDIALLDLYMPRMTGLDVIRTLKASGARTVFAIMTGYSDSDLARAAIAAGAMAFVAKSRLNDDLLEALRSAIQGIVFVSKDSIPKSG